MGLPARELFTGSYTVNCVGLVCHPPSILHSQAAVINDTTTNRQTTYLEPSSNSSVSHFASNAKQLPKQPQAPTVH